MTLRLWHHGVRIVSGKRAVWVNHWLAHPCADCALIWEVGLRAAVLR